MKKTDLKPALYPDSELEDLPSEEIVAALKEIGKEVGKRAVAEAKALGLPITFIENEWIIKEYADGKREILGKVPPSQKVQIGAIYERKPNE
ncbi:MAG: hypothetical protein MUC59_16550 [Saprospiraceae bacterium]|jgi:hypothetical protein|nr:hypothetical protein [Saprospiraceae bacterium]